MDEYKHLSWHRCHTPGTWVLYMLNDSLRWPAAGLLLLLNSAVFLLFAADKGYARANSWRIPEKTLLLGAAVAPFGAILAMRVCRHKTGKLKFLLVPLFCILQAATIFWLAIVVP